MNWLVKEEPDVYYHTGDERAVVGIARATPIRIPRMRGHGN